MSKLTTTSFALLGFLATRPYSTYELTKQMSRTLRYMWPRAESRLYEEAKNLVDHGLASADHEYHGKRRRTIYSITPEGREALSQWLSTSPARPHLEFEGLVRVFFADLGTKEHLLAVLGAIKDEVESMREIGRAVGRDYLAGQSPSQARAHVTALMFDFLWRYTGMIREWAEYYEQVVEEWDDLSPEGKIDWAMERFAVPFRNESED